MVCCCTDDQVQPQEAIEDGRISIQRKMRNLPSADGAEDFDGPVKQRSCTDIFFLILFICFISVLIGMYVYCAMNGDIRRVINGYDSDGDICGLKNEKQEGLSQSGKDLTEKKFLYYRSDPSKQNDDDFVIRNWGDIYRECRSECPTDQKAVLHRCIPKEVTDRTDKVFNNVGISNYLESVSEDLQRSWRDIVYMCIIALGAAFVLIVLMRYQSAAVVWAVLIIVVCVTVICSVYLWIIYNEKAAAIKENRATATQRDRTFVNATLAFASIATIITFIILVVIFVCRKRIRLVVQLFEEAGKSIAAMPLLLIQPFWTFMCLVLICSVWFSMCVVIESSGFASKGTDNWIYYAEDGLIQVARWYNLLALFWMIQFCIACQHIVVAGAVCTWFFTRNKTDLGSPISSSTGRLVRYHLGSVALGSLFVAFVQFLRTIMAMMEKYLSDEDDEEDDELDGAKIIAKCCQCCLMCIEKILKFINRNAYIIIALHGFGFCKAAKKSFGLLMNNAIHVATINSIGDFVLFMAKVAIIAITMISGYGMLKNRELSHLWIPLIIGGIFSYFISHCFISIYEMAIDTVFLCFCEDVEHNDGVSRSYYMSKGLMEFVENSRKMMDDERRKMKEKKRQARQKPPAEAGAWQNDAGGPPPYTIANGNGSRGSIQR